MEDCAVNGMSEEMEMKEVRIAVGESKNDSDEEMEENGSVKQLEGEISEKGQSDETYTLEKIDTTGIKDGIMNGATSNQSGKFEGITMNSSDQPDAASCKSAGNRSKGGVKSMLRRTYKEIAVLAILIVAVWALFMLPTLFYHLADVSLTSCLIHLSGSSKCLPSQSTSTIPRYTML